MGETVIKLISNKYIHNTTMTSVRSKKIVAETLETSTLALASGDIIKDYKEGTHTTTWSGTFAAPIARNISFSKVGNMVTLNCAALISAAANNTPITMTTNLPSFLRPAINMDFTVIVVDNTVNVSGAIQIIASTGHLDVFADVTGASFTAAGNGGFQNFSIHYLATP